MLKKEQIVFSIFSYQVKEILFQKLLFFIALLSFLLLYWEFFISGEEREQR